MRKSTFSMLLLCAACLPASLYGQGTVTDIDGNTYNVLKIGNQRWMKENLRVTRLNDGTPISNSPENTTYDSQHGSRHVEVPLAWVYDNDIANDAKYGKLYNWYAVNTGKLCPEGWHIPTNAEWDELQTTLGKIEASKKMRTADWRFAQAVGTNESGFTALPAGFAASGAIFREKGISAAFWTGSPSLVNNAESASAIAFFLYESDCPITGSVAPVDRSKATGQPCRCVADGPGSAPKAAEAPRTGNAAQQEAPVLTVYENKGYTGRTMSFGVGEHDITETAFNDVISAIKVRKGYKVTLYKDWRFTGASIVLTADTPDLARRNFDKDTSSLKVEKL